MCQCVSNRIFEVPYRYSVQGKAKLALRSAAFGTWLSVTSEGATWQNNAFHEPLLLFNDMHDPKTLQMEGSIQIIYIFRDSSNIYIFILYRQSALAMS